MNGNFADNKFINPTGAKYNSVRTNTYTSAQNRGIRTDIYGDSLTTSEYVGELVNELKRKKARERASRPVYSRKRVKSAQPFPFGFILSAVVVTAVFMFIAYNYSVINEISYDTAALEDEIELYMQENERLSVELEKKNDLSYIEQTAVTKLGMVKSTDVYKQYVSLSGNDKTVVSDKSADEFGLGTTFNSFKKTVGKIFE